MRWVVCWGVDFWDFDEGTINSGSWYHYVLTYNSGTGFKLYKNGSLQDSSGVLTGTIRSQVNDMHIGRYNFATSFFDGKIDEIGFWNKSLTSIEISDLYNDGGGLAYE